MSTAPQPQLEQPLVSPQGIQITFPAGSVAAAPGAPAPAPPAPEQRQLNGKDDSTWPQEGHVYVYADDEDTYLAILQCPIHTPDVAEECGGGRFRLQFKKPDHTFNGTCFVSVAGPDLRAILSEQAGVPMKRSRGGLLAQLRDQAEARKAEAAAQQRQAPAAPASDPILGTLLTSILEQNRAIMQRLAEPQQDKVTDILLKEFLSSRSGESELDKIAKYKTLFGDGGGGADKAIVEGLLGLAGTAMNRPEQRKAETRPPASRQLPAGAPAQPAPAAAAAPATSDQAPAADAPQAAPGPADEPSDDELREQMSTKAVTVAGYEIATHAIRTWPDDVERQEALQHCAVLLTHLIPRSHLEQLSAVPAGLRPAVLLGSLGRAFGALKAQLAEPHAQAFVKDLIGMVLDEPSAAAADPLDVAGELSPA